jgi:hypothetical protein
MVPPADPGSAVLERTLERAGILPRPQRDVRPLWPQLQALEEIADSLPDPVAAEFAALDVDDQAAAEGRAALPERLPGGGGGVLVGLEAGVEHLDELGGDPPGLSRLASREGFPCRQEPHDPVGDPARMGQIERHLEEGPLGFPSRGAYSTTRIVTWHAAAGVASASEVLTSTNLRTLFPGLSA